MYASWSVAVWREISFSEDLGLTMYKLLCFYAFIDTFSGTSCFWRCILCFAALVSSGRATHAKVVFDLQPHCHKLVRIISVQMCFHHPASVRTVLRMHSYSYTRLCKFVLPYCGPPFCPLRTIVLSSICLRTFVLVRVLERISVSPRQCGQRDLQTT